MSGKARTDDVQKAVLKSATKLLNGKGYEGTTIKDISRLSGVSTGSIYHFFGSKDGVLARLIQDMFDRSMVIADRASEGKSDPYLTLSLELTGQVELISRNPKLARVYAAVYRSWLLTQVVLSAGIRRNRSIFAAHLPEWGEDQYFAATSVIKGVLSALADERIHLDRLTPKQRIETLLRAVLPVFGASDQVTQKTIAAVLAETESRDVTPGIGLE